jgi:hypothetical protein
MSPTQPAQPTQPTQQELEAQIEAQREQLADTVDALAAKLDVKSRARAKAVDLRQRATTDTGKPRPDLVGAASVVLCLLVAWAVWRRRR